MANLGRQQAVTLFFGMKFLGVEEAAHTPEADIGHLDNPVPFDGDIQVITEATATGTDDGFVPGSHVLLAPNLV
jgi:hypothetical protein